MMEPIVVDKHRPNLSVLADKWPSSHVARDKVEEFSGGIIKPKYLANLDSLGKGPSGRVKIGRKVAYPVSSLIAWLQGRARVL